MCRMPLRAFQTTNSKAVDNIIERCILNSEDKNLLESFQSRKKEHKSWLEQRTIKDLQEGTEIDVRDTE